MEESELSLNLCSIQQCFITSKILLCFAFIELHYWDVSSNAISIFRYVNLILKFGIKHYFSMSLALFPHPSLLGCAQVITYQTWFWFGLIIDNLNLVFSGRWTCSPSSCQTYFFDHLNTLCPRFSSLQQFSGWKYLLTHRGLAMVRVKRDISFGLILGLMYKLPCKVYFDLCTISPFCKSSRKNKLLSQCFNLILLCAHIISLHVMYPLELEHSSDALQFVEKATNHSNTTSAHDYSQ